VSSAVLGPDDLNEIALAAYYALVSDRVERSQVNKLIEVLESTRSVEYLLAHIARQVGRGIWGGGRHLGASRLFSVLRGRDFREARTILGIFKWLYEAGERRQRDLQSRLGRIVRGGGAPQDFYMKYIEALLASR